MTLQTTGAISLGNVGAELGRAASTRTPPSEVSLPPSNAAVTFLPRTAGNENTDALSSHPAGVVCGIFCPVAGLA